MREKGFEGHIIELDEIKRSDAWRILNENPKFEEEFYRFINNASYRVNTNGFNMDASLAYNDEYINFSISGKRITLSYISKIINRDLDCQYKTFNKIEFYINKIGDDECLVVNESSGRLESKYGYSFENSDGGVLITDYSYKVYAPFGVELSYQSYSDKRVLDAKDFSFTKNNNVLVHTVNSGAVSPLFDVGNSKQIHPNYIGKNPRFLLRRRSLNNIGLVEVSTCSFNEEKEVIDSKDEYYFNTLIGSKPNSDPYLININNGLPLAYMDSKGNLIVNYGDDGVTENNYEIVAKFRFYQELKERINALMKQEDALTKPDELPKEEGEHLDLLRNQINKYMFLIKKSNPYNNEEKKTTRRK